MNLEAIVLLWISPFILLIAYAAWRDRSAPLLPHSTDIVQRVTQTRTRWRHKRSPLKLPGTAI